MKKIEIKKRFNDKVIHSYEYDGNTVGITLENAILEGADLGGADLGGANLGGADLDGADLRGADLRGANLEGADLGEANLREANLRGADLEGADLREANLGGADLEGANLRGANLGGADLEGANLRGANLYQVSGIGSAGRCTTYDYINNKIICGCYYGTLEEFKKKCNDVHGDNKFGKQYNAAILYFEAIKKIEDETLTNETN